LKLNRLFMTLAVGALGVAASLAQDFTQAELEKMVSELDAVSTRNSKYIYPIKCSVVTNDEVNAYASIEKEVKEGETPQAVMVVYSGLVKFCKGDRRIIRAVVAHEVSHLMLGHVNNPVFVAQDIRHLWTRQQEMAADAQGAILLEKAGYSKKDMVDMLFKLDELESDATWMWKLAKNDHTSAKNRAAQVSGNPAVMRSMMAFEKGLAYWECRSYQTAARLFEKAYQLEPKQTDALINAAQVSLMDYYDNLPAAVQDKWFRPDFGPMLTDSRGDRAIDPSIRPEDIARFKVAMDRIANAKAKLPTSVRVSELESLATIIAPDDDKTPILGAAKKLEAMMTGSKDFDRLRLANNVAVGYHRAGDVQKAYDVILAAQKSTTAFSPYVGQNLGRFNVPNRPKEDEALAADVMLTWLKNTPTSNTYFQIVKDHYVKSCEALGVKPADVNPKPTYLCNVVALNFNGKEAGILIDSDEFVDTFGAPLLQQKIDDKYPDVQFWVWKDGALAALTERGQIIRVSSSAVGAYIDLKASDPTVNQTYRVTVGMSTEDFGKVLDLSKAVTKKVVGTSGNLEEWSFYPGLLFGVRVADGKIAGITVAPIHVD